MTVDFEDLKRRLALGEALLIDVREKEEWNQGHLTDALFVPLSNLDNDEIPDDLPEDKSLFLYCRRGMRAMRAAAILGEHHPDCQALMCTYEELCAHLPSDSE